MPAESAAATLGRSRNAGTTSAMNVRAMVKSSDQLDGTCAPRKIPAAVLTCLAEQPPEDAFRPAYTGSEKNIYREKDVKWDLLPKIKTAGTDKSDAEAASGPSQKWLWPPLLAHYLEGISSSPSVPSACWLMVGGGGNRTT